MILALLPTAIYHFRNSIWRINYTDTERSNGEPSLGGRSLFVASVASWARLTLFIRRLRLIDAFRIGRRLITDTVT